MDSKYKVGDLVILNAFGQLVLNDDKNRVGLIVAGPFNMLAQTAHEPSLIYWAYDIMVGEELLTEVPQEFIDRMITKPEGED